MAIRTRIGVMVPSTNTTCEADFQMVAPPNITIHGHRMWITNEANGDDAMNGMNDDIETAAKYLATAKVDAVRDKYSKKRGQFFF